MPEQPVAGPQLETLTQRRFRIRLKFVFGPRTVDYTVSDPSGKRQFTVPYEAINMQSPAALTLYGNSWLFVALLFLAGVFFGLLAGNADGWSTRDGSRYAAVAFLAALSGLYFLSQSKRWAAIKYTVLALSPPPPGSDNHSLKVIDNRDGPRILRELRSRWRARMRVVVGITVNLGNAPEKERMKFDWLRESGIIDEAEHEAAMDVLSGVKLIEPPDALIIN